MFCSGVVTVEGIRNDPMTCCRYFIPSLSWRGLTSGERVPLDHDNAAVWRGEND